MSQYAQVTESRSLGKLIKELRDETTHLLRREVDLAKAEMTEKANTATRQIAYIAAGGAVAYAGFVFVLTALTYGLMLLLAAAGLEANAAWLAPAIVGIVVGVIGAAFMAKGISTLKKQSPKPGRTLETVKGDKDWVEEKVT